MFIEDLNKAIAAYRHKWLATIANPSENYLRELPPTAVGWKTTDINEFNQLLAELREYCDQIHLGWVNDRWLASMHLKNSKLEWGVRVIKLMQRRPGSSDATMLDHVDFLAGDIVEIKKKLSEQRNLKWSEETNNPHCSWLSIWFENTEAKLRSDTVLDVCIAELQEVNRGIRAAGNSS